jgi:peptidoglycan/LPS O-acetylase OafA/YrhL
LSTATAGATRSGISLSSRADTTDGPADRSRPRSRLRGFRPDIEGLRALAVLAVVLYHAGVPGFGGGFVGVDVFLVISGFLITRHLLAELTTTGRVRLLRFWARRVRRLLPAATVVTVVTVVAGWLVLDPLRARDLVTDALYTAGYAMNWHLAAQGTDYLTATAEPSALQHYWSLAVEEQFYLVWPVLLVAAAAVLRVRRRTPVGTTGRATARIAARRSTLVVACLLVVVLAVSLLACLQQTGSAQPFAYFGLHTRAWELAAGALVAVAADRLGHLGGRTAAVLTWAGAMAVAVAVVGFSDRTVFPGVAALLPVLGSAAVVAGGCSAPRHGVEVILARNPLQVVGALSYGWYLWHWPLLQLVPAAVGHPLDLRHRLLVSLVGLALAAVSYALLEYPVRRLRWPELRPARGVALGVAMAGATAAVAAVSLVTLPDVVGTGSRQSTTDLAAGDGVSASDLVARQVSSSLAITEVPSNLTPSIGSAAGTLPAPQTDEGCHASFADTRPRTDCVYGDRSASRTMVLFGDSHALQWFPAVDRIAKDEGYRLVSMTKSSCTPFAVTTFNEALRRTYSECDTWRRRAVSAIRGLDPSLVVVSTLTGVRDHGLDGGGAGFNRAWADGAGRTVRDLRAGGSQVAVVDDTTNPGQRVPACLAGSLDDAGACAYYRAGGLYPPARRAAQRAAVVEAGAADVDPTPWLCAADRCPVVVGNLLVFRDEQHLSTAYARYLAPPLRAALRH